METALAVLNLDSFIQLPCIFFEFIQKMNTFFKDQTRFNAEPPSSQDCGK